MYAAAATVSQTLNILADLVLESSADRFEDPVSVAAELRLIADVAQDNAGADLPLTLADCAFGYAVLGASRNKSDDSLDADRRAVYQQLSDISDELIKDDGVRGDSNRLRRVLAAFVDALDQSDDRSDRRLHAVAVDATAELEAVS